MKTLRNEAIELKREYDALTEINDHCGADLLLAKHFGTNDDVTINERELKARDEQNSDWKPRQRTLRDEKIWTLYRCFIALYHPTEEVS